MAIEMVRIPSETPNIANIDDFVGLRYAYGNQDGYVANKGNECSYSINGNIFKINSGRLVLQGVECDINANGVEITIESISATRYFTIYLQVNLALNETKILSQYDTATYPIIESGDDLTQDTSGVARLPLFHFVATNGVISSVEKIVGGINYYGTSLENYDYSKGTIEKRLEPLDEYDNTKGTIEERLTNLGFKQGNIVDSSGDVVGTVTRQGNYVIAKITKNITVASNTFVYFNITSSSSEYGKEVFLPQSNKSLFDLSLTGGAIWWLAVYNNNAKGSMATYHTQGNYLTILENENTFGWEVPPIE